MIDASEAKVIAEALRPVIREEIEAATKARAAAEEKEAKPAKYWAEKQLRDAGQNPTPEDIARRAEALIKRAKRGSIGFVMNGCRYYFTAKQIGGGR